jgi:hypothetical protein
MVADKYVWVTWSSAFLVPWIALFLGFSFSRRVIILSSVFTMPFGLTEPLFVPRYWNPPSLFDLARHTGFDLESLIFCFAIGGVGVVLYNAITHRTLQNVGIHEQNRARHRYHRASLLVPFVAFPALSLLAWNPIYSAILAMVLGGAATVACRPDLKWNTVAGGAVFAGYYAVFMVLLEWSAPGYIARVWNLTDLSGVMIVGVPLEELLFGFAFGICWSGIYEHVAWQAALAPVPVDEHGQSRK